MGDTPERAAKRGKIEALVAAYGAACRDQERAFGQEAQIKAFENWKRTREALINAYLSDDEVRS